MSTGHCHLSDPSYTINQNNVLGDRPCVRQSQLYRQHCGGNEMKNILGHQNLNWNTKTIEGCYAGRRAYNFNGSAQDGGAYRQGEVQSAMPNMSVAERRRLREEQQARQQEPPQRRTMAPHPAEDEEMDMGTYQQETSAREYSQVQSGKRRVYGGPQSQSPQPYQPQQYQPQPQQQQYRQQQQQYQPQYHPQQYEEGPYDEVQEEPYPRQGPPPRGQDGEGRSSFHNDPQPGRGSQPRGTQPISGSRAQRPGAGYANRQTYNIFTGK